MAYTMINTHEGVPVMILAVTHGTEIPWIDDDHCMNDIETILIRDKYIVFMNQNGHEFASLTCTDHTEACNIAMARYAHIAPFEVEG